MWDSTINRTCHNLWIPSMKSTCHINRIHLRHELVIIPKRVGAKPFAHVSIDKKVAFLHSDQSMDMNPDIHHAKCTTLHTTVLHIAQHSMLMRNADNRAKTPETCKSLGFYNDVCALRSVSTFWSGGIFDA